MKLFMNVVDWEVHSLKKNRSMNEVDICGCDFNICEIHHVTDRLLLEIVYLCYAAMKQQAQIATEAIGEGLFKSGGVKNISMDIFTSVFMSDQNMAIARNHIYKHLMKGLLEFDISGLDIMYTYMPSYSYKNGVFSFLGIKTEMMFLKDVIPHTVEFIFKK